MNFEQPMWEVVEKIASHLTVDDYFAIGHNMQERPDRAEDKLWCTKCKCRAGSEFSLNWCGSMAARSGGYLDFKSTAMRLLKDRVGTLGIPVRERRVI